MNNTIQQHKFVELTYKVIDAKTGDVLSDVQFPLGYVHGVKSVLSSTVTDELEGKQVGDVVEVPIDCDEIYGRRDNSLVFADDIENVPEAYREVGTKVTMENDKGETKTFYVTKNDGKRVTIDGNSPMSGRNALFTLEVLSVREATDEEVEIGGPIIEGGPDVDGDFKKVEI
jgi:FKBP-type peptidyl-prolyl cis-trans isomerase SlyD